MWAMKCFLLLATVILLSACNPSIEDDARSAADLTRISNEYARNNDMAAAGKAYNDVQDIMNKYKELDRFDEFFGLYNSYVVQYEEASAEKYFSETEGGDESTSQEVN